MTNTNKTEHNRHVRYRDNASGRFVSDADADKLPGETTSERVKSRVPKITTDEHGTPVSARIGGVNYKLVPSGEGEV